MCFDDSPLPLSSQITLAIQDIDSLLFSETFMISKETVEGNPLIPNPSTIDDVGSCCILAERFEGDNILVYISMRFLKDNQQAWQEILSVVDGNLKLIHEKRIERLCNCGRFTVAYNLAHLTLI